MKEMDMILRIYRTFKSKPKKIFLRRDFGFSKKYGQAYLDTLVKLGLTERVIVYYGFGVKRCARKEVRGYKLK